MFEPLVLPALLEVVRNELFDGVEHQGSVGVLDWLAEPEKCLAVAMHRRLHQRLQEAAVKYPILNLGRKVVHLQRRFLHGQIVEQPPGDRHLDELPALQVYHDEEIELLVAVVAGGRLGQEDFRRQQARVVLADLQLLEHVVIQFWWLLRPGGLEPIIIILLFYASLVHPQLVLALFFQNPAFFLEQLKVIVTISVLLPLLCVLCSLLQPRLLVGAFLLHFRSIHTFAASAPQRLHFAHGDGGLGRHLVLGVRGCQPGEDDAGVGGEPEGVGAEGLVVAGAPDEGGFEVVHGDGRLQQQLAEEGGIQMINMFPRAFEKGPKNYEVCDDEADIPTSLSKKLRANKNAFGYFEEEDKDFQQPPPKSLNKGLLPVPNQMEQAFIKYMLVYRVISYLSLLSISISLIAVYFDELNSLILILANNAISLIILAFCLLKLHLYLRFNQTKRQTYGITLGPADFVTILIILPHPLLWTPHSNTYLHIAVMARILIPIKYSISSSVFCDVRAYRLISTYGLNSNEHFFFAVKSIVAEFSVMKILAVELLALCIFTHCLYLASLGGEAVMSWMDCFEVVIVSIPTVGFGEYDLPLTSQKVVVVLILVMGTVLNSLITLSMLSQLNMDDKELSSYWLMQKVETREHIEKISKNYIQKSFGVIRCKNVPDKVNINFCFRNEYRLKKNLYNSISYTDINNLFAYFRESLKEFRLNSAQTNNMMDLLLHRLHKENFTKQIQL